MRRPYLYLAFITIFNNHGYADSLKNFDDEIDDSSITQVKQTNHNELILQMNYFLKVIADSNTEFESRIQRTQEMCKYIILNGPQHFSDFAATIESIERTFLREIHNLKNLNEEEKNNLKKMVHNLKIAKILLTPFYQGENLCLHLDSQIKGAKLNEDQILQLFRPYIDALNMVNELRSYSEIIPGDLPLFAFTHIKRFYKRNHLSLSARFFSLIYSDHNQRYQDSFIKGLSIEELIRIDLSLALKGRAARYIP